MDVEQIVRRVDKRPQHPRATQLGGCARTVEDVGRPYAIEILVDEARSVRACRIEAEKGLHVRERKRERTAHRTQFPAQQAIHHDRAANLVAVRERVNQDVRTGLAALEGVNEIGPGGRATVRLDVRCFEFDWDGRHEGHLWSWWWCGESTPSSW